MLDREFTEKQREERDRLYKIIRDESQINIPALLKYARLNNNRRRIEELYDTALEIDENDVSALLAYANFEVEHGRGGTKKVEGLLQRVKDIDIHNPYLYIIWSKLKRKTGNFEEAITILKNGLEYNPRNAAILTTLGTFGKDNGHWKLAENYLEDARNIQPKNFIILNSLGNLYKDEYRFGKRYEIDSVLPEEKFRKAEEIFKNILSSDENNTRILTSYAVLLSEAGKFDDSTELFQKAVKISPTNYIYASWANAMLKNNPSDIAMAKKCLYGFEKGFDERWFSAPLLSILAKILSKEGRLEAARSYWSKATRLASSYSIPNCIIIYNTWAKQEFDHGNLEKAEQLYQEAYNLNNVNTITLRGYAKILEINGKGSEAEKLKYEANKWESKKEY